MTLGQRVAVLRDGVLQCDTPQSLFEHPTNLFVAAFIGSPSMNVVEARVSDGRVTFAGLSLPLPPQSPFDDGTGTSSSASAPRTGTHRTRPSDPRISVRPDLVEELGGAERAFRSTRRACRPTPRVRRSRLRPMTMRRCSPTISAPGSRVARRQARRRAGRRSRPPSTAAFLRPRDRGRHQSPVCGGRARPRAAPSRSSVASSTAPPMPVGVVTARLA